jgi:hypothetical protein
VRRRVSDPTVWIAPPNIAPPQENSLGVAIFSDIPGTVMR